MAPLGTYFRWKPMVFGQKSMDPLIFFVLVDDFNSSQNHEYVSVCNFERRKSYPRNESCRSKAFNRVCFQIENYNKWQTDRLFCEISVLGALNRLFRLPPTTCLFFYKSPVGSHVVGGRTDLGSIGAIFCETREIFLSCSYHGVFMV